MIDTNIIWGVKPILPLRGFPEGSKRIRQRCDSFTVVFVRPPNGGVRRFYVEERSGEWWPAWETGANLVVARVQEVANAQ